MRNCLLFAVLGFWALSASAQDKTLTFDNASPPKSVRLLNGTSVTISTAGNLSAKCVLNGSNCADVGNAANAGAPTVSLSASSFSSAADGTGKYGAGTTLNLTPTVTNADVCLPAFSGGATDSAAWSGAMVNPSFPVRTVSVPTGNSTYNFVLNCYNSSGMASSNVVTVATNTGSGGGGNTANCTGVADALISAGFSRAGPTTWRQLMGADNFPDVNLYAATVPKLPDAGFTYLGAARNTYTSVEFTTPASWDGFDFLFEPSQIPGTVGSAGYITISRCQGDVRFNISPQLYPTDAPVCKSFRSGGQSVNIIYYNHNGQSDSANCGLAPNTTYYLNYINIDPSDGVSANEHTCYPSSANNCGVQIRHQ